MNVHVLYVLELKTNKQIMSVCLPACLSVCLSVCLSMRPIQGYNKI